MVENISPKPESLVIDPPIDENNPRCQRHIEDRHGSEAVTIGSKALPGVSKKDRTNMLKAAAAAYQKLIDEQGNPGRKVFAFQAEKPMGTNALVAVDHINESAVFSTTRDYGTPYQSKIRVALVSKEDMPKTNVAHVVMGPTGEGKANVYTMIYGDEGMPFPKEFDENTPKEILAFNNKCKEYWDSHVFLTTPEELKANIDELKAKGVPTILQEQALRKFNENGQKSPVLKPYRAPVSQNAVKLTLNPNQTEAKVNTGR